MSHESAGPLAVTDDRSADPLHRVAQRLAADMAAACADFMAEGKLALAAAMAQQRQELLATLSHPGD